MANTIEEDFITAADLRIALNDEFPELTYGSVPVIDQCDALQSYLAIDDDLGELPPALAAYISHQQHCID